MRVVSEKNGEEVKSMYLEIPVKKEDSSLFLHSEDYLAEDAGFLPQKSWSGPLQAVWVGSEDRGIQWFAESLKNWKVKKRNQVIRIIPCDKETTIRIYFYDFPVFLKDSGVIEFGLIATPVKLPTPGYRRWRITWNGRPLGGNINPYFSKWGKGGYPNYYYPKEGLKETIASYNRIGFIQCAYITLDCVSAWVPEDQYYWSEWARKPDIPLSLPEGLKEDEKVWASGPGYSGAKSRRDFTVWAMKKAIEEVDFRGIYIDGAGIWLCRNYFHGHGYINSETGILESTKFNILSTRKLAMRIYRVLKNHNPKSLIFWHSSGRYFLSALSFADAIIDGENFTGQLNKRNHDYTTLLTLDKFRAEMMGHNLGPVGVFLTEFSRAPTPWRWKPEEVPPEAMEHILGLTLLHDSHVWPANAPLKPVKKIWKALRKFGWNDDLIFLPYWKERIREYLSWGEKDIVVSAYLKPDNSSMALVIFNNSPKEKKVMLKLNPEKLPKK